MRTRLRRGMFALVSGAACHEPHVEPLQDAAAIVSPSSLDAALAFDAMTDARDAAAANDVTDAAVETSTKPALGCARCKPTEYCVRKDTMGHGQGYGLQSTTTCEPLPARCATKPSCACVAGDPPDNCTLVDGQVRLWFPARNP